MNVQNLFQSFANEPIEHIAPLPQSGSARKYVRISGKTKHALGVENADFQENTAFIDYTRQFENLGLNVPKILAEDLQNNQYLIEDLGDETLFSYLSKHRIDKGFSEHLIEIYEKVITQLLEFQIKAGKNFNYEKAYQHKAFDRSSMLADLNYFRYFFLKLAQIPFDEYALEQDFDDLANVLLTADSEFFMFRDFQSRNIMLHNEKIFFIDYQGGRKGALHYDLASLLYQAKAEIPNEVRERLLNFYIAQLRDYQEVDEVLFKKQFYGFVLIRVLQTLGAYGFRGFYEKKEHFLKSIPFAIDTIEYLLKSSKMPLKTRVLGDVLTQITQMKQFRHQPKLFSKLCININSFSFKKSGYPPDSTGNGGGFVFDCRGLPNPGRFEKYKSLNGKDEPVKIFLEQHPQVADFVQNTFVLVEPTIKNYIERNFENLQINFGCTGGQHRSVYCAEKFFEKISQNFDIQVVINHIEQN